MRGFVLCGVCVCVLLGPQIASAGGGSDDRSNDALIAGGLPPASDQLGQVVGSFTYPNPPVQPFHNVVGIADDGHGRLY